MQISNELIKGNHKVPLELCSLATNGTQESSMFKVQSIGRTELAQRYFPYILPKSAWEKLKALLLEDPALQHLATLRRRTFLPAEVNIIYQHLGQPRLPFLVHFRLSESQAYGLLFPSLETLSLQALNFQFPYCSFPRGIDHTCM